MKDADLRERHLGDLQGMVLRDAAKASPSAYKAFLSHRTNQDIPVSTILNFLGSIDNWKLQYRTNA